MFTARYGVNLQIQSLGADLSVRRSRFSSGPVYVKFVVDTFLSEYFNFALSVSFHSLYHLNVPLRRRTNVRSRAFFKKAVLFRKSENIGQTSISTSVAALGAVHCLYNVFCRRFLPSGPWARTV